MAWHYRKRNLLKELLTHRPDIMCLQEVQSDHFTEFLQPELTKAGYMGIYKKKTTEIFTGRSVLLHAGQPPGSPPAPATFAPPSQQALSPPKRPVDY